MSVDIIDDAKNTLATLPYAVDFEPAMATGDTISAYSVKVYETSTLTETTATMLVTSSEQVSDGVLSAMITGGTDGVKYSIVFLVTTANSETHAHVRKLKVKDERK